MKIRPLITVIAVLACGVALTPNAMSDSITLKNSIRLTDNSDVITLADIAELEGDHARELSDLLIARIDDPAEVMEIPLREVRAKLEAANVHWGRVNLSGRSVIVRPNRSPGAHPPMAMTAVAIEDSPAAPALHRAATRQEQLASDIIHQPNLRSAIANMIVSNLRHDPAHLRLSFAVDDRELLETPTNTARFELHPHSSFNSDRIEFSIRAWKAGQVQETSSVSVLPLLRVMAASARHDISPNQLITDADVVECEQWLPPSQASQIVSRVSAIGRLASRSIQSGDVLRDSQIRRETLIKRGDLAIVRCLVGGAVISLQAEARADGSQGELIEFRKQGERETFLAKVTNCGEAVVDLSRR